MRRTDLLMWLASTALLACGVQASVHDQPAVDPNNDFGPSMAGMGNAGSLAVVSMPTAGTGTSVMMPNMMPGGSDASVMNMMGGMAGSAMLPPVGGSDMETAGSSAMDPPPSGVTIDIGGTTVAKEDAIAFIHIGHSNMAGRATGPQGTRPYYFDEPDPHAWMYHVGQPPQPAQEPYTAGDDLSGIYGGPGTALVKEAAALAPDKYFISLGFGKTSAYCSQFLPGALYYDTMMEATLAIKDRVTFAAIVILLGITERHGTAEDINGFPDCINQLVTAIRNDVGRPDLPVLMNEYEQEASGALSVSSAFAQKIIPQIEKVPSVVSNSALVPTDGLAMEDDHHFNFDGHKEYMGRVLQLMQDHGWFPWAKP